MEIDTSILDVSVEMINETPVKSKPTKVNIPRCYKKYCKRRLS